MEMENPNFEITWIGDSVLYFKYYVPVFVYSK